MRVQSATFSNSAGSYLFKILFPNDICLINVTYYSIEITTLSCIIFKIESAIGIFDLNNWPFLVLQSEY